MIEEPSPISESDTKALIAVPDKTVLEYEQRKLVLEIPRIDKIYGHIRHFMQSVPFNVG